MTANAVGVLVVDDEPQIRRLLRASLIAQDYRVSEAETGQQALDLIAAEGPEIVILDLGLPDLDGLEVLTRIRAASRVPVVVLSSRSDERSKVQALELGADDYVTKPFGMAELLARLRTALRHGFQEKGEEPIFRSGEIVVDQLRRRVAVAGREVKLSPIEFAMLSLLVAHAGKVLTHRQILQAIWGNAEDVQYLRVYVRQLRRKLEADPERPRYIVTEPGVGYRFQLADEA
jgi:two-component system KDP operon response regulator KdpE